ncbi:unnamed protein product [Medioppia subpectinata]|uniref:Uncharacterized protein n=1 Tax=Medioppia subpectinata TaxID=1979941 RepID=A0A7R9KMY8_9ACAR|nr:unnamed protein product [Medioppia subpectinata]CAG2106490.1 unnamed protein product [Medioppia subpectinata]
MIKRLMDSEDAAIDSMKRWEENKLWDIILFPLSPFVRPLLPYGDINLSRFVDNMDADVLIKPRSAFEFIDCWDSIIYLSVVLSLISIGVMFGLRYRSVTRCLQTIWTFSAVILSDTFHLKIVETCIDRMFAGIWLLVCTLLLSLYSGDLYDTLMRGQSYHKLENKYQLYTDPNYKDSQIWLYNSDVIEYIVSNDNEMTASLIERIKAYGWLETATDPLIQLNIVLTVLEEKHVLAVPKFGAYYMLNTVLKYFPRLPMHELYKHYYDGYMSGGMAGVGLYVSDSSNNTMLYKMGINAQTLDQNFTNNFDKILCGLQESGVYDNEVKRSLKPNGYEADITDQPKPTLVIPSVNITDLRGLT